MNRFDWEELGTPGPDSLEVGGVELRRGSRVRLAPRPGADVFDVMLAGRVAVVEGFDQDLEDNVMVSVTVEDDPGRDFGDARQPGHRFFFAPDEVEPLGDAIAAGEQAPAPRRILVAGIGNIFLGDDAFGVELAGRLQGRPLPAGVEVVDYGIRGMDLAYAMQRGYDTVVFLDATPLGKEPGTLYVIEPERDGLEPDVDAHGMDPVKVLRMAEALGAPPTRVLVVGCEPENRMTGDETELVGELSEPVRAALDEAVALVEELVMELTADDEAKRKEGEPT